MSERRETFNSGYFSQTVGPIRSRYEQKIEMCTGVDPYELREGMDTTASVSALPSTTYEDIVNYLVLSTSFVTLQEMKVHKSLEAHNYFTSGWVHGLSTASLTGNKVLVLSKVNHSQRLRDAPLKVWILGLTSGEILTAHCTCMAGAGEACSHLGATLFAVEAHVRIRESITCTGRENAWLPPPIRDVEFKRIRDIDFCCSKSKKCKLDGVLQDQNQACINSSFEEEHLQAPEVPSPTAGELDSFYKALDAANATPAIFSILEGYNSNFRTAQMRAHSA